MTHDSKIRTIEDFKRAAAAMSKKKSPKAKKAQELLGRERIIEVWTLIARERFHVGDLITAFKTLGLDTCADPEFRLAFVEMVNARHTLKVLLEHPVFLGALADAKPTEPRNGDNTT